MFCIFSTCHICERPFYLPLLGQGFWGAQTVKKKLEKRRFPIAKKHVLGLLGSFWASLGLGENGFGLLLGANVGEPKYLFSIFSAPSRTRAEPNRNPNRTEPKPNRTEPNPSRTEPEPNRTGPSRAEPKPKPKPAEPKPNRAEAEPGRAEAEPGRAGRTGPSPNPNRAELGPAGPVRAGPGRPGEPKVM